MCIYYPKENLSQVLVISTASCGLFQACMQGNRHDQRIEKITSSVISQGPKVSVRCVVGKVSTKFASELTVAGELEQFQQGWNHVAKIFHFNGVETIASWAEFSSNRVLRWRNVNFVRLLVWKEPEECQIISEFVLSGQFFGSNTARSVWTCMYEKCWWIISNRSRYSVWYLNEFVK